eukprot:COSAG02_NODE_1725_length_11184_cov_171.211728_3_plen_179_part_00
MCARARSERIRDCIAGWWPRQGAQLADRRTGRVSQMLNAQPTPLRRPGRLGQLVAATLLLSCAPHPALLQSSASAGRNGPPRPAEQLAQLAVPTLANESDFSEQYMDHRPVVCSGVLDCLVSTSALLKVVLSLNGAGTAGAAAWAIGGGGRGTGESGAYRTGECRVSVQLGGAANALR